MLRPFPIDDAKRDGPNRLSLSTVRRCGAEDGPSVAESDLQRTLCYALFKFDPASSS